MGLLVTEMKESIEPLPSGLPLDGKLREGFSINEATEEAQFNVALRLARAFSAIRQDTTREHGTCIAYTRNPVDEVFEQELDNFMIDLSLRQNHGMKNVAVSDNETKLILWKGTDPTVNRDYSLVKQVGFLILDNGIHVPDSRMWSLLSRKVDRN